MPVKSGDPGYDAINPEARNWHPDTVRAARRSYRELPALDDRIDSGAAIVLSIVVVVILAVGFTIGWFLHG